MRILWVSLACILQITAEINAKAASGSNINKLGSTRITGSTAHKAGNNGKVNSGNDSVYRKRPTFPPRAPGPVGDRRRTTPNQLGNWALRGTLSPTNRLNQTPTFPLQTVRPLLISSKWSTLRPTLSPNEGPPLSSVVRPNSFRTPSPPLKSNGKTPQGLPASLRPTPSLPGVSNRFPTLSSLAGSNKRPALGQLPSNGPTVKPAISNRFPTVSSQVGPNRRPVINSFANNMTLSPAGGSNQLPALPPSLSLNPHASSNKWPTSSPLLGPNKGSTFHILPTRSPTMPPFLRPTPARPNPNPPSHSETQKPIGQPTSTPTQEHRWTVRPTASPLSPATSNPPVNQPNNYQSLGSPLQPEYHSPNHPNGNYQHQPPLHHSYSSPDYGNMMYGTPYYGTSPYGPPGGSRIFQGMQVLSQLGTMMHGLGPHSSYPHGGQPALQGGLSPDYGVNAGGPWNVGNKYGNGYVDFPDVVPDNGQNPLARPGVTNVGNSPNYQQPQYPPVSTTQYRDYGGGSNQWSTANAPGGSHIGATNSRTTSTFTNAVNSGDSLYPDYGEVTGHTSSNDAAPTIHNHGFASISKYSSLGSLVQPHPDNGSHLDQISSNNVINQGLTTSLGASPNEINTRGVPKKRNP